MGLQLYLADEDVMNTYVPALVFPESELLVCRSQPDSAELRAALDIFPQEACSQLDADP